MPPLTTSDRLEKRVKERLVKAMATYSLISDDDRILVALSGGKDSMCLLELLALRRQIRHPRFELEALHVRMSNIHYESDTSYLTSFASDLGVRLHVRTTGFDASTDSRRSPCFLCSWYRPGAVWHHARPPAAAQDAPHHHPPALLGDGGRPSCLF